MSHNHKCTCNHTKVKFCKTCNACYCVDCHTEWKANLYQWCYPYNTYLSNYPNITSTVGGTGGGIQTTSVSNSYLAVAQALSGSEGHDQPQSNLSNACSHGED